jgi:hypothetical protein
MTAHAQLKWEVITAPIGQLGSIMTGSTPEGITFAYISVTKLGRGYTLSYLYHGYQDVPKTYATIEGAKIRAERLYAVALKDCTTEVANPAEHGYQVTSVEDTSTPLPRLSLEELAALRKSISRPTKKYFSTRRLTDEEVKDIRELHESLSYRKIADLFGVSLATISNIITGKTYSDVQ